MVALVWLYLTIVAAIAFGAGGAAWALTGSGMLGLATVLGLAAAGLLWMRG